MLVVFPGSQRTLGRAGGAGTTLPLSEGDMQAVRDKVLGVVAISGFLRGNAAVVRGNTNWITSVNGIHDQYLTVRDWKLSLGRDLLPDDVKTGNRVALLGTTVVSKLFPTEPDVDPTGQVIRIKNVPFTIVGVLESKGQNSFGQDQDDVIMLPITAARGRIIGRSQVINDQVGSMFIKFDDETNLTEAQEQIESVLRQRRKVQPGSEDDFNVRNLAETMRARTAALSTMSWLLAATSAIALIVGGIGIMNIMLVSVTERTREIGLRMAVGGRRRDILLQFLVEAVTLCLIGGLIGIALGILTAFVIASQGQWPVVINVDAVVIALAAAALTGVFFGFFPARRAAHLNPIDALRSE